MSYEQPPQHDGYPPPPQMQIPPQPAQLPPQYTQFPPQYTQFPPQYVMPVQPMVPLQPIQTLPEHPRAQAVLILSIIGVVFGGLTGMFIGTLFGGLFSYIAWLIGALAKKEIEQGAEYLWGGNLQIGYWIAKISSIVFIAIFLLTIVAFACFSVSLLSLVGTLEGIVG